MSKHTPGPWRSVKDSSDVDEIICDTMNGYVVIPARGQRLGCYLADNNLIAAAPDLLEALEAALTELDLYAWTHHPKGADGARDFNVVRSHAKSAIAKARGEA